MSSVVSKPEAPVFARPHLPETYDEAVLLVDKPKGWSSFDVIRRVRPLLKVRKIGHAGTLDPMATGLLILLIGRATKRMEAFMSLPKTYVGTLRLGEVTPSYDAETEVSERRPADHVSDEAVDEAMAALTGAVEQVPPMYSAVKVGGERLYRKARRGEDVERAPRSVNVYEFERTARDGVDVMFRVRCSKGTYVRTLAHDVGALVGVGAHLVMLRRTAVGPYEAADAWTVDALREALGDGDSTRGPVTDEA